MRIPLDPSHLDMPGQVVIAIGGFCSSLALAGWQMLGDMFTQLPTPKDMTGWEEKHVYLWIALLAFLALGVVLRWIAGQFMCALNNNTAAMNNNTSAMNTFNSKVESLVVPAMQHAMDEAFRGDTPIPRGTLAAGRKRSDA